MKIYTPVKAMRKFCIQCMGNNISEPKKCEVLYCPLWPYRKGTRPTTLDSERLKDVKEVY